MKKLIIVSCIVMSAACAVQVRAQSTMSLLITEILYDAEGSDASHEWVEVYNPNVDAVEIVTGLSQDAWRFYDGSSHTLRLVQGTSTLPSRGFAVVASDADVWRTEHPSYAGTLFDTVMSLSNTSSTVALSSESGGPFLASVTYDSLWGGSGTGYSLERADLDSHEETQGFWREGTVLGGTPGLFSLPSATTTDPVAAEPARDQDAPPPPSPVFSNDGQGSLQYVVSEPERILLSELLPNPTGDDRAGEWIELENTESRPIDIAGWILQDDSSTQCMISEDSFAQTTIAPYGFFIVRREQCPISLNNANGDTVRLYRAGGSIADAAVYRSPVVEGYAWARFDSGFAWTEHATPGAQNDLVIRAEKKYEAPSTAQKPVAAPAGAPLVVRQSLPAEDEVFLYEILPNPDGRDSDEWLSIRTIASSTVDLMGWSIEDASGSEHTFATSTPLTAALDLTLRGQALGITLNNAEEEVRLKTPSGALWQTAAYSDAPSGVVYRYSAAAGSWLWVDGSEADESVTVLGENIRIVDGLSDLEDISSGTRVRVSGVVLVPPELRKGKMLIAGIDATAFDYESLIDVAVPEDVQTSFERGDVIEFDAIVRRSRVRSYLVTDDASTFALVRHAEAAPQVSESISDLTTDQAFTWRTIEAPVVRKNKKSLSVGDDSDRALIVVPENFVSAENIAGALVTATGLLEYSSDKPRLTVFRTADIALYRPTATAAAAQHIQWSDPEYKKPTEGYPWQYLATVPIAGALVWSIRKFVLPKLR